MLLNEFRNMINYRCSVEEYNIINNLYLACDSMTKSDCVKIWNITFGNMYKNNNKIKNNIEKILIRERKSKNPSNEFLNIVNNAINKFTESNIDKTKIVDENGVEWIKEIDKYVHNDYPYSNKQYILNIRLDNNNGDIIPIIKFIK